MPRPKSTDDQVLFNARIDKKLREKGLIWAKLQGSSLATEFKRWLITQIKEYERENGTIKRPETEKE